METPEREALFEEYRGEGWEKEYQSYRNNWSEYPQTQFIADYPLLVDLELSTLCNLHCPMCYTITKEFKQKVNACLMDFSLFKKIIDEIGGKVPAVRLSLRGEPTIHSRFIDCITYAKLHSIREISFLTNGSKLKPEFFTEILEAGADWITVSIDGIGQMYEQIRRPLLFADTLNKIMTIKAIKEKCHSRKPVIKIQSIWPAIRDNPELYYRTFAPYVDLVAFNPLIDYLGKDEDIVYEENFSCCQLYQRLVIGSDGRVMMCSNDEESSIIVGNANKESIYSIWHGKSLSTFRDIHKSYRYRDIPICRRCYLPRRTEEHEIAYVNNRKIIIKNYIGRSQEVGK